MNLSVYAVVLAAGSSSRMKGKDKIFQKLSNDKEVIINTINQFDSLKEISRIILVARFDAIELIKSILKEYKFKKPIDVIAGGSARTQSLFNGFEFIKTNFGLTDSSYFIIHDGARPLIRKQDILSCLEDAVKYQAATIGFKIHDTIKEGSSKRFIDKTVDRSKLFAVQTPQIFNAMLLDKAIRNAKENNLDFTDDCQLVESIGSKVYITEGSRLNFKITTQEDIELVNAILNTLEIT